MITNSLAKNTFDSEPGNASVSQLETRKPSTGLKLYQKLSAVLVVFFVVAVLLLTLWLEKIQTLSQHEAEQRLHINLAEHLVQDNPIIKEGIYDYDSLQNLFHTLMVLGPSFEFYFLDPQGNILTYSANPDKIVLDSVDLSAISQFINGPKQFPLYGPDPRHTQRQKIFSAAPVLKDETLQGYIYVIIGGQIYDSIWSELRSNQQLTTWLGIAVGSLLVLFWAMAIVFRFITRPLNQLSQTMESIRSIGFNKFNSNEHTAFRELANNPIASSSRDEVQTLSWEFEQLLIHVQNQFDQLQQLDLARRTLLADLSHDLRTPLASLQGFLETMSLKLDDLSNEDQLKYLHISLKSAHNLKRLVDQIFDLAYLESGQVKVNLEVFPIGELIFDVTAKFEQALINKKLELVIDHSNLETRINADIEKLERVLSNIIDNGIRHTPDGGKIQIELSKHQNQLKIAVSDTGVGISDQDIQHIFDARYQGNNSEQDHQKHIGLGLAISQKLVAILNSELKVSSELGKGSCFYFELSVH